MKFLLQVIGLALNTPWAVLGLVGALLSGPTGLKTNSKPPALAISVRSFWWLEHLPGYKGVRAATLGNVVLLGPSMLTHDLEHEYIHVEQGMRRPFIHPILNGIENLCHGHKHNRYEREAYRRAGNRYIN